MTLSLGEGETVRVNTGILWYFVGSLKLPTNSLKSSCSCHTENSESEGESTCLHCNRVGFGIAWETQCVYLSFQRGLTKKRGCTLNIGDISPQG